MRLFTTIVMDGTVFAAVLFLISVGLTLVFGVLRILNVAHGGLYAFGAFTATSLALWLLGTGANPYLTYLMLLLAPVIVGLIAGPLIERVFLQRVYGRAEAIQLLLTFSIFLILDDLMKLIWGTKPLFVSEPYTLLG
ncbi:MAG TPA: branched-chain amino acid ABC transporter permease, partial [Methylomirabilota bacterium]|nr:branched-chain amino acid ABC transporter permease [Methylomirabilota bacterium]